MRSPWIDPRVLQIKVAHVRAYLTARGWREIPFPDPDRLVFRRSKPADDGTPFDLVLPAEEWMDSYPQRTIDLVGTVARLEKRLAAEVISDMLDASANGTNAKPALSETARP